MTMLTYSNDNFTIFMREVKKICTRIVSINVTEKCVYFSRSAQQSLTWFYSYFRTIHIFVIYAYICILIQYLTPIKNACRNPESQLCLLLDKLARIFRRNSRKCQRFFVETFMCVVLESSRNTYNQKEFKYKIKLNSFPIRALYIW